MAKFIDAKSDIEELLESKEQILKKAGNTLASVCSTFNNKGITDSKAISGDIGKLLNGFTEEEKNKILTIAITKLVINL